MKIINAANVSAEFRKNVERMWQATPAGVHDYMRRGGWVATAKKFDDSDRTKGWGALACVCPASRAITYFEYFNHQRFENGVPSNRLIPTEVGPTTHYHEIGHVVRAQSGLSFIGLQRDSGKTNYCNVEAFEESYSLERQSLTPQQIKDNEYYLSHTWETDHQEVSSAEANIRQAIGYYGVSRAREEAYAEIFSEIIIDGFDGELTGIMPRTAAVVIEDMGNILPSLFDISRAAKIVDVWTNARINKAVGSKSKSKRPLQTAGLVKSYRLV